MSGSATKVTPEIPAIHTQAILADGDQARRNSRGASNSDAISTRAISGLSGTTYSTGVVNSSKMPRRLRAPV